MITTFNEVSKWLARLNTHGNCTISLEIVLMLTEPGIGMLVTLYILKFFSGLAHNKRVAVSVIYSNNLTRISYY